MRLQINRLYQDKFCEGVGWKVVLEFSPAVSKITQGGPMLIDLGGSFQNRD
jgi:hypothetical protein